MYNIYIYIYHLIYIYTSNIYIYIYIYIHFVYAIFANVTFMSLNWFETSEIFIPFSDITESYLLF